MGVLLKPSGPVDRLKLDLGELAAVAPRVPKVRMALVGGYQPKLGVLPWTLVGRDGRRTRSLTRARFFTCSAAGVQAACAAARALRDRYRPGATDFVARVLVTGEWDTPVEVVAAYRLETGRQVNLGRYSFE